MKRRFIHKTPFGYWQPGLVLGGLITGTVALANFIKTTLAEQAREVLEDVDLSDIV